MQLTHNGSIADTVQRDPRWPAVVSRDPGADGSFVYSVRTTGIYCRPSCGSRRANPENVRFHRTAADAEQAGFRACLRCVPHRDSPRQQHASMVAAICREIESAGDMPSLAILARRAGLSPQYFHRVFKAVTGVTPRGYATARRAGRVRKELENRSQTVTAAMYESGFNSGGRFYEASDGLLGMTPTAYRNGGATTTMHFAVGECSLGSILVARSAKGVCAILIGDSAETLVRDLQDRFPHATLLGADRTFEDTMAAVIGLIDTPGFAIDLPLDVRGTAFQQRVWQALRAIPIGSTASYREIAARIGAPNGARAVAQACGANPLAVAIPCHRVIRTDGSVSGYRWGIDRKRRLLEREASSDHSSSHGHEASSKPGR